jgi:hypothetical protein
MIAIGEVNPPCFSFDLREDPNPPLKLSERSPAFGPRFVEFTADDGSRILASWQGKDASSLFGLQQHIGNHRYGPQLFLRIE